ncbi:hypothetical protein BC828DRAFT_376501 [Blastocladiella britannica]|nr:hypothetical protein BC828DRAFT_376501 [Blastocladiella britannica]
MPIADRGHAGITISVHDSTGTLQHLRAASSTVIGRKSDADIASTASTSYQQRLALRDARSMASSASRVVPARSAIRAAAGKTAAAPPSLARSASRLTRSEQTAHEAIADELRTGLSNIDRVLESLKGAKSMTIGPSSSSSGAMAAETRPMRSSIISVMTAAASPLSVGGGNRASSVHLRSTSVGSASNHHQDLAEREHDSRLLASRSPRPSTPALQTTPAPSRSPQTPDQHRQKALPTASLLTAAPSPSRAVSEHGGSAAASNASIASLQAKQSHEGQSDTSHILVLPTRGSTLFSASERDLMEQGSMSTTPQKASSTLNFGDPVSPIPLRSPKASHTNVTALFGPPATADPFASSPSRAGSAHRVSGTSASTLHRAPSRNSATTSVRRGSAYKRSKSRQQLTGSPELGPEERSVHGPAAAAGSSTAIHDMSRRAAAAETALARMHARVAEKNAAIATLAFRARTLEREARWASVAGNAASRVPGADAGMRAKLRELETRLARDAETMIQLRTERDDAVCRAEDATRQSKVAMPPSSPPLKVQPAVSASPPHEYVSAEAKATAKLALAALSRCQGAGLSSPLFPTVAPALAAAFEACAAVAEGAVGSWPHVLRAIVGLANATRDGILAESAQQMTRPITADTGVGSDGSFARLGLSPTKVTRSIGPDTPLATTANDAVAMDDWQSPAIHESSDMEPMAHAPSPQPNPVTPRGQQQQASDVMATLLNIRASLPDALGGIMPDVDPAIADTSPLHQRNTAPPPVQDLSASFVQNQDNLAVTEVDQLILRLLTLKGENDRLKRARHSVTTERQQKEDPHVAASEAGARVSGGSTSIPGTWRPAAIDVASASAAGASSEVAQLREAVQALEARINGSLEHATNAVARVEANVTNAFATSAATAAAAAASTTAASPPPPLAAPTAREPSRPTPLPQHIEIDFRPKNIVAATAPMPTPLIAVTDPALLQQMSTVGQINQLLQAKVQALETVIAELQLAAANTANEKTESLEPPLPTFEYRPRSPDAEILELRAELEHYRQLEVRLQAEIDKLHVLAETRAADIRHLQDHLARVLDLPLSGAHEVSGGGVEMDAVVRQIADALADQQRQSDAQLETARSLLAAHAHRAADEQEASRRMREVVRGHVERTRDLQAALDAATRVTGEREREIADLGHQVAAANKTAGELRADLQSVQLDLTRAQERLQEYEGMWSQVQPVLGQTLAEGTIPADSPCRPFLAAIKALVAEVGSHASNVNVVLARESHAKTLANDAQARATDLRAQVDRLADLAARAERSRDTTVRASATRVQEAERALGAAQERLKRVLKGVYLFVAASDNHDVNDNNPDMMALAGLLQQPVLSSPPTTPPVPAQVESCTESETSVGEDDLFGGDLDSALQKPYHGQTVASMEQSRTDVDQRRGRHSGI